MHRSDANGGNITFDNYESLAETFAKSTLHPADLKSSIEHFFDKFFEPIRERFLNNDDDKAVIAAAFPPAKSKCSHSILRIHSFLIVFIEGAKQKNTPSIVR